MVRIFIVAIVVLLVATLAITALRGNTKNKLLPFQCTIMQDVFLMYPKYIGEWQADDIRIETIQVHRGIFDSGIESVWEERQVCVVPYHKNSENIEPKIVVDKNPDKTIDNQQDYKSSISSGISNGINDNQVAYSYIEGDDGQYGGTIIFFTKDFGIEINIGPFPLKGKPSQEQISDIINSFKIF